MSWKELRMLTKGNVGAGMKMLFVFALVLALHSPVLGYGSAKEGKCPPLPADVNCAFKLINSDSESIPCNRQDLECLGDMKCCEDGCGGYECKPAIGLPPLPVIEPHCISAEVRVGDQCEPANITYCYADRCNSCCVHNSVCNPSSEHISLEECKEKLCHGIKCPGQGEICVLDKYHRAVCRCPTECPPDTPNMPVCGSDGLTHENECEMNMTACVTGDRIRVVNQGSCRRNPREVCSLPKDKGFGWTLDLKYYFNKQKGVCEGFIYHGKGGNENNFEKYKDCVDMCFGTVSDVCVLPKLIGPCRAAFPRWHFNSLVRRCESFIYGGCAGNRNNFESEEECNNQCVCNLPKAPGICLGYFPSWFYNSRTEKCEKFIYGGCHGNANRFYSQERCQNSCGGGADDVLKPRCHGKSKFNCHSIKKCLPISKKCNGVDDCGDNSDEEGCDPCADKKCDFYSTCVTTKNNTALCDCPTICTADWNPVCGSDNETYPNLCTMQVESCQRQELITKVSDGECGGTPRTKCEIHRDEQQSKMLVGVYIPQCEEDGSYRSKQCHGSTGYCWCVDGEGNKLMETEVEPGQRLNCTGGPPPTDPPVNICDMTVCEFGSCVEVDGNATCQCHKICPLLYDPVCGTNNKTYPNPCVMDAEACEKKEVIRIQYSGECKTSPGGPPPTDPPVNICDTTVCEFGSCVEVDGNATCQCHKICPLLYDPVCGTNNKTYVNPCVMEAEACEKKDHIQKQYSGECKTSPGGPLPTDPPVNICDTTVCEFGSCVEVYGNATCQCHKICPLLYNPVCGTNNKTYVNPCVMEAEACEKKDHIQKQYSGECKETIDVVKVIKDPCQDFECKYNAHCVPLTNGSSLCECPQICTREFDPVCGSDGLTYSNPCEMRVASCEKQELITKTHSGRCGVVRISGGPLSKCEKERAPRENGSLLLGAFIPQCEVDGSYSEVQCLGSTGYCWCVDSEGNKLLETEVKPGLRPNCTKETRHKTKCEKERATRENGPLLVGAFIPQCEEDGSYSEVQCYGSTGYCWCVDSEGNKRLETEVGPGLRPNCTTETRPKTKCEKEKAAKENGPLLIGAFIPQCEEDGSYSEVQCRGSTGYCWCVDSEGNKRLETEVGPGLRPNCTTEETFDVVSKIKDPCRDFECKYNALCVPLTNGSRLCECPQICTREFDPVCGSDGLTYSNPCEMRVASCEKQELITKEHNGRCGVVRISGGPLSKCEKEKFARENGPLLVGEFIPLCEEDGSYSEVQCHGSTGYCWCVDSEGNKRLETEVDPGLRPNCTTETRPKTKCEKEKAAKENGPLLVGAFIPQCEEDGSYSEVQCRGSTGYCWCVDSEGNKRLETEVGPGLRPNCTTEQTIDVVNKIKDPCQDFECKYNALCVPLTNGSRLCECPQICTREFDPVCGSDGLTYSNPCEMRVASCEKQELITKAHNGRCGVKRISGGPLSKCEKEKFARGNGPFLLGKFIPQCEEDGSYSEVQCRGSTGYCWCVDNEGNKRLETEVGPGLRPNCTTELPPTNPPLDPCDIHVCEFGVCVNENGTAKCVCHRACPLIEQPVCGSDNKTYFSLCVMDGEACERKTYIKAKHNGPCGTKSKCQKELEMAMARQQPGTFIPKCEEDGRYSSKQCHTSTGYCWCATPQGEKILETQLRFKHPDCSKNIKFDPCASVECDFYGTCVALDNGDHICDCPRFCTKEYAPVCASNGKTYGSICEMKVASCATQQMLFVESNGDCGSPTTTAPSFNPCDISLCDFGLCVNENGTAKCVCNQACPFIEQPVCGSDNKTYANLCVMDAEACERKQRITVQNDGPCEEAVPSTGNNPCALIDCPFYSECELSNGIAECVCALGCTRELNPKCGSDNITYDNPCELRRASCEAKKEITIVKDGECIVPTTALPTVAIARPAKCKNCPKFGEENVVSSFCKWYNKFAIIGEFLNMSKNGREITVKVETKYKPIAENTKFIPKSTVRIKVQKVSNCQCDNLEFKKNERYVFMGKKTTKRTFVIKWKTGFVEKVSKPLVKKLNKSLQRLKTWGFCVQRSSG